MIGIALLRALSFGVLALALPLYITSLGGTAAQWGLLSGVVGLAQIPVEPAWGWVSDRIGLAVPLGVSRFASALLTPIFGLTSSMGVFLAVQIARGVFEVAVGPLSRKALAQSFGSERKGMGIGVFQACWNVGLGIGPLLGGYVLGRWGYAQAFALYSGLSFVSFVLVVVNRAQLDRTGEGQASASVAARPDVVEATTAAPLNVSFRTFIVPALIAVFLFLGIQVTRAFVPLLGSSVAELPPSEVALLLTISGMVGGILVVFMGRLSDRLGRRRLIVGGLALLSISLIGYGFSGGFVSLAAVTLLNSVGTSAALPALVALVSDITPSSRQGQMLGIYGSFENVGVMLGPLLCGFLWDAHSPRLAFVACGLVTAVGIVLASRYGRRVLAPMASA